MTSMTHLRVLMAVGKHTDKNGWTFASLRLIGTLAGASDKPLSRSRTSEVISDLVEWGYLEKRTQNRRDGSSTTNLYRVVYDSGEPEDLFDATEPPFGSDEPPFDSHGAEPPFDAIEPNPYNDPSNVPSKLDSQDDSASPSSSRKSTTMKTWLADVRSAGEQAIPEDDPIFDDCEKTGLPIEYVHLCWAEFKDRHVNGDRKSKRYKDWRAAFRNAVRDGWYKLWGLNSGTGEYFLTTVGRMTAMRHGVEVAQ
ncbi:hypothetical protein [Aquitalea sp. USM4]|uniref:hypothetical protein n=1 Tax=Aquitalea sp. USM4 TaxID=1590041 RepID=UPI00103BAA1B|nr:hypothetical protein [Aquitalea sp. USM4]QBJ80534.1 hypothetical protein DKK66_20015 [Aquitalea sp. USM4]